MVVYSVFQNPNPRTNVAVPFLLDVQSEAISLLATRVVVPLYRPDMTGVRAMSPLTPVVQFQGQLLVAMVPELAGIAQRDLGPACGTLASARGDILKAIDLLLTGF